MCDNRSSSIDQGGVSAIHVTSEKDLYVAAGDGTVTYFQQSPQDGQYIDMNQGVFEGVEISAIFSCMHPHCSTLLSYLSILNQY